MEIDFNTVLEQLSPHYDGEALERLTRIMVNGIRESQNEDDALVNELILERFTRAPMAQPKFDTPTYSDSIFVGPLGELALLLLEYTEASPIGLYASLLTGFGNICGLDWMTRVESSTPIFPRLFTVLVGETSRGRKGTATNLALEVLAQLDETWYSERIASGLSSGEGLVAAVRDPQYDDEDNLVMGSVDRRLMVIEPEWGGMLESAGRPGNVITAKIRQAADGRGNISVMTKIPQSAHNTMISIIGHVTPEELQKNLSATDMVNGFANRFLFFAVERSKFMREVMEIPWTSTEVHRIERAVSYLRHILEYNYGKTGQISLHDTETWYDIRVEIDEWHHSQSSRLQALSARADNQVARIALILALAEQSPAIMSSHLLCAFALVKYSLESLMASFNAEWSADAVKLYYATVDAGPQGMTRVEQWNLFGRHMSQSRIDAARQELIKGGIAFERRVHGKGRPSQHLIADKFMFNVLNDPDDLGREDT